MAYEKADSFSIPDLVETSPITINIKDIAVVEKPATSHYSIHRYTRHFNGFNHQHAPAQKRY